MKFRMVYMLRGDIDHAGAWRRRYGPALADARDYFAPFKRGILGVEDSKGRVRLLGESQLDRAADEYHRAIAHRDAVGVWG